MAELTTALLDVAAIAEGELILSDDGCRIATDEDNALLGLGQNHMPRPYTTLPYRMQDAYSRATEHRPHRVAILDNGRLRATFLLDFGGRLWTLRDLAQDRELLHQPERIQLANFALRDAWFAGGVEWNLGVTGHWGLTCEPVNAAVISPHHVRMWAFERLTTLVWQIDAHLPEGADALSIHVTLTNPHDYDVPLYWWSNIAVPQSEHTRVLFDAEQAYHFAYEVNLTQVSVPVRDGVDITYPQRHNGAADYFFLNRSKHPWIAAVDDAGKGVGQSSTAQLRGRKMFTWGAGPGARTWQAWLSGAGEYTEIQAGLGTTQLEHQRLTPGTTVSFTECYRPISLPDPDATWEELTRQAARACVDGAYLEQQHRELLQLSRLPVDPAEASLVSGDWGALEVAAGFLPVNPATVFDTAALTNEQRAWLRVAQEHQISPELETSALVSPRWAAALSDAPESWLKDLLLGYTRLAAGDVEDARGYFERAVTRAPRTSSDACRALSFTLTDPQRRADLRLTAHLASPRRRGMAVEAMAALLAAGRADEIPSLIAALPPELQAVPRIQLLRAQAALALGDAATVRDILAGPLTVPDLREGDTALDQLWRGYQQLLGSDDPLPAHYDFRMARQEG